MASDEEDFVFHGTPIEREEEMTSRRKKAVAEASGNLRSVVPWKQEVTDEEGRRRFHGAFTGGFSAGYYNTVGSKEGWTPKTFTSSRKNRAEFKQQDVLNFLDDDEKEELEGRSLGTSMKFDTFGFTAAELARKQADKEQQQRPSVIPGPAPDELVVPTSDSIGVKLLLKMGWRHGHAIKDSRANSLYDARREARKAFLAFSSDEKAAHHSGSEPVQGDFGNAFELPTDKDHELPRSTQVYVQNPKQDLHGLGYDPFKHAPEFRENKRSRLHENKELGRRKPLSMKDSLLAFRSERAAPGFGIGALEELDIEDEDVYASGYAFEETYLQDIEEPSMLTIEDKKTSSAKKDGVLNGFKVASNTDYQLERFDPPVIPKDFQPHHVFPAPLESIRKISIAPPSDVPPPNDKNLKILIDGVATMIARSGKLFEDLSREKNQSNPLFSFLNGGDGHAYYTRRLWEEREKRNDKKGQKMDDANVFADKQKLTAENRGNILGEKPLERSSKDKEPALLPADVHLQYNLSDTFTKSESFSKLADVSKPYQDDPAKQERFEQFLKEKYHGGLRTKDSGGSSNMSEATRARERLEFEAAALALEKGNWRNESAVSNKHLLEISVGSGLQFTPSTKEQANEAEELLMKMYPKREEFQWYPSSILCKRFDIMDPYMGKPPPPPRARSKMDSLIFMPNSIAPSKVEETGSSHKNSFPGQSSGTGEMNNEADEKDLQVDVEVENVERPVDLYKAIFSDDSDNEEESSTTLKQSEDSHKKSEVANTTLSRLIAGDFLESLGKELGLEVPPDQPYVDNRVKGPLNREDTAANGNTGNTGSQFPVEKKPQPALDSRAGTSTNQEPESKPSRRETVVNGRSSGGNMMKTEVSTKEISGGTELSGEGRVDKISRTDTDRRRHSSSSSEDDRKRKRSKRHKHRRSDSESDASYSSDDDDRERHRSRSRRKKGFSREKSSSSRKHSKHHHKHRREDSDSRSSRRESERREGETKRDKRR